VRVVNEQEGERSTVPDRTVEQADAAKKLIGWMSVRQLAALFNVSPSTVQRDAAAFRRSRVSRNEDGSLQVPMTMGVDGKLRPSVHYDTSGRDALIRSLRARQKTIREIAEEVGCSVGTVHRILKVGAP
jgi:transposase